MHSIELYEYSPGTWWTKIPIIRLARKFCFTLICTRLSLLQHCGPSQPKKLQSSTETSGLSQNVNIRTMDIVPIGSVLKPRRWCYTRNWGQPTSPSPNPDPIWRESPCPSSRRSQTSQTSWTGNINKDMDLSLSLSHGIRKRTKTKQNATKHHIQRTDAPDLTGSLATSIPASHIFMRGFTWWCMTDHFNLVQMGGFSQGIVVCISRYNWRKTTWHGSQSKFLLGTTTARESQHPPTPLRTSKCPWRGG